MNEYITVLKESLLFKGINEEDILDKLSKCDYSIKNYNKDSIIAVENDDCHSLGIILRGSVEIHKPFPSGKIVTINNFYEGNIFGEALVFSGSHVYPATIIASSDSDIMYISKENIIKLMKNQDIILENFMSVLSNRILMLNDRITTLSYDTVRKKIANIILIEYSKQKNKYLLLPFCRRKMAQLLNIPRPSLSRELMKMKEDKIIDYYKNRLQILNMDLLEECLLN